MLLHDNSVEGGDEHEPDESRSIRKRIGSQRQQSKDQSRNAQNDRKDVVPTSRQKPVPVGIVEELCHDRTAFLESCSSLTR